MFKRSALFAIAASAVLGLALLASTDASARPAGQGGAGIGNHARFAHVGPRFNGPRFHGPRFHGPRFYNRRFVGVRAGFVRPYWWKWGAWRPYWKSGYWRPYACWRHPLLCRPRPGVYGAGAVPVVGAAAVAAPYAAAPARCLIQTRLADGNSLFRNVCTNEAAITSGATESAPEAPPLK